MSKFLISKTLKSLGFKPKYCGYVYLREAIKMVIDDFTLINAFEKVIYSTIGDKHGVYYKTICADITYAITKAFKECKNKKLWDEIFGRELESRPANNEFIPAVADYIMLQGESEE